MVTFTGDDDKSLLLLAVLFEDSDGVIDWIQVQRHLMSFRVEDLQHRLHYLTVTDVSLLRELPMSYVKDSSLAKAQSQRTPTDIYTAVEAIFGHLTKADLRQPCGKGNLNTGEIAPIGVTAILEALQLTPTDVFVDIGSGSGSILVQVTLQSPVKSAIGLEIQTDLAQKSMKAIMDARDMYPRLHMVKVVVGDIKAMTQAVISTLSEATVIFSNNLVFKPQDNLALEKYITQSLGLRSVMVTSRFCARCSSNCTNLFCQSWIEEKIVPARTCWSDTPLDIYYYTQKPRKWNTLLDIIKGL